MKKPVRLRIDCKNQLINYEKWFVYKGATTVIESTESQVYDTREGHEDERLDNGTCEFNGYIYRAQATALHRVAS